MVKQVKCSLHKHEEQSSDPQLPHEKSGTVARACNPGNGNAETGGCLELSEVPV